MIFFVNIDDGFSYQGPNWRSFSVHISFVDVSKFCETTVTGSNYFSGGNVISAVRIL